MSPNPARLIAVVLSVGTALCLGACLGDPPTGVSSSLHQHPDASAGAGGVVTAGSGGGGAGGAAHVPPVKDSGARDATTLRDGGTGDATTCSGGGACDPGTCGIGQLVCQSGAPVCTKKGNAQNGTPCDLADAGGVCNVGVCAACSNGTDCTPQGTCAKRVIACNSGKAVCTASGTLRDGTECGTNEYCSAGVCAACANGKSCVPPANLCHQGKSVCTAGKLACTDLGTLSPNGTSCGDSKVCNAGACVACEENVVCTPANECHAGLTSCATGTSVCVDTGTAATDGGPCTGQDKCKGGYSCSAGVCTGTTAVACAPPGKCHTAGTCNPATGVCAYPLATDGTTCDDGNACTSPDKCLAGVCSASSSVACARQPAGSCLNDGACDPTSGQCVSTPKTDGTACGVANSGMTCTGGTCGCTIAGETPCNGICVDEQSDSNHCGTCGTVCALPKTCNTGACSCAGAKPTFCAASTSCVNTTSDPKNCGACGHDCLGAACLGGYCQATTIGSTPNGQGMGLAISATTAYFTDGPGGHVYTCPLTGCTGTPTAYFSGINYASGVAYDASTKYVYVSDQNNGVVHIVTAAGTSIVVSTGGTPQGLTTDATYLYFADYSGVGKVDKAVGGAQTRVFSGSTGYTKGVSIDPTTGRVWAAVGGASGQVVSCLADGSSCSTWSFLNMVNVHVIKSIPYLVSSDGLYMCPSTSDCSITNVFYTVGYTADITNDATNIYFSNAGSGIAKCAVGGCGQNPTAVINGAGTYAADITSDATYIYWISGAGAVQRVVK